MVDLKGDYSNGCCRSASAAERLPVTYIEVLLVLVRLSVKSEQHAEIVSEELAPEEEMTS